MKSSRLSHIVLVSLSIALPASVILPRLIEAREASKPIPGTPVIYEGEVGAWNIIEDKGDSYLIRNYMAHPKTDLVVAKSEVEVSDRWTDDKYRWYSVFR